MKFLTARTSSLWVSSVIRHAVMSSIMRWRNSRCVPAPQPIRDWPSASVRLVPRGAQKALRSQRPSGCRPRCVSTWFGPGNYALAVWGFPNIMVALAVTPKGAPGFAQFVAHRLAEVPHAAARARTEVCAMISTWTSSARPLSPLRRSATASATLLQNASKVSPSTCNPLKSEDFDVPDGGVIIEGGFHDGYAHGC